MVVMVAMMLLMVVVERNGERLFCGWFNKQSKSSYDRGLRVLTVGPSRPSLPLSPETPLSPMGPGKPTGPGTPGLP